MARRIGSDDAGPRGTDTDAEARAAAEEARAERVRQREAEKAAEAAAEQSRLRASIIKRKAHKGDGITAPMALTPEEVAARGGGVARTDAPRDSRKAEPSTADRQLRKGLPGRNRLARGDGMTNKRATLPSVQDEARPLPAQPTVRATELVRSAQVPTLAPKAPLAVQTPDVAAPVRQPRVPARPVDDVGGLSPGVDDRDPRLPPAALLPITKDNADDFSAAFEDALAGGAPWAQSLESEVASHLRDLGAQVDGETRAMKLAPGGKEKMVRALVQKAADAGESWAVVALREQIPSQFVPITDQNRDAFRAAYQQGLDDKAPWALALKKQVAAGVSQATTDLNLKAATMDLTAGAQDQMVQAAVGQAASAGEPWATIATTPPDVGAVDTTARPAGATPTAAGAPSPALSEAKENGALADTTSTEIPPEWVPVTADNAADFSAALKQALSYGDAWALNLMKEAQDKVSGLQKQAEDKFGPFDAAPPEDDGPKGRASPEQRAERWVTLQVKKAQTANEPWALALKADSEAKLEQHQNDALTKATNTNFLARPPAEGVMDTGDHNKVKGQVDVDGSMKVPSIKEPYVVEYIRSNPVVQDLRQGGAANIYTPLYAEQVAGAVKANGGAGAAPPEGKGFLALTDHGFAICYNPSRTPEENKRLAELSLKAGLTFDQVKDARVGTVDHHDGKLEDALAAFDAFDPTQPGEVKIALDGTAKGKYEFTLHSDGKGSVSTIHEHNQSTWTKIGQAVAQWGLPIAAVVCAIVPGLQGVAAGIVSVLAAAKGVYEGIKNGDWLGAVIGVIGAVGGGFLTFANATTTAAEETLAACTTGAARAAANTAAAAATTAGQIGTALSNIATAASAIRNTVNAVQSGDLAGILKGVGGAALAVSNVLPGSAQDVAAVFKKISDYAGQAGQLAAFGEAGLAALKNGDYLTAFTEAVKLGSAAGSNWLGLDPALAQKLTTGASAIEAANSAIKNKDWAGAVGSVLEGIKDVTNSNDKLLAGGITISSMVSALAHQDPLAAAKVAGEFILKLTDAKAKAESDLKDPNTAEKDRPGLAGFIAAATAQLDRLGGATKLFDAVSGVVQAVKNKDPAAIVETATGLIATLTNSGQLSAAKNVIAAARRAYDAAKNGDFFSRMQAASELGAAISGALQSLSQPPEAGTLPPAKPGDAKDPHDIASGVDPTKTIEQCGRYTTSVNDDSLKSVAKKMMGDEGKWMELYAWNAGVLGSPPGPMRAGLDLEVPPEGYTISDDEKAYILSTIDTGGTPPPDSSTGSAPPGTHTVVKGETLSAIAARLMKSSTKWIELYAYNRDVIGDSPNSIRPGMELQIPPEGWPTPPLTAAQRKEIIDLARPSPSATTGTDPNAALLVGLKPGSHGSSVKALETTLQKLGFFDRIYTPDEDYNTTTAEAVQEFQKSVGLPDSGEMDQATVDALLKATPGSGSAPVGGSSGVGGPDLAGKSNHEKYLAMLDFIAKSLDGVDGVPQAVSEAASALKSAFEAAEAEGKPFDAAAATIGGTGAFGKFVGESIKALPMMGEGAKHLGESLAGIGDVLKAGGATISVFNNAYQAITGKTTDGKKLTADQMFKMLYELPFQLKDIASGASGLLSGISGTDVLNALKPTLASRMASAVEVANPWMIAVTLTKTGTEWLLKNVYADSRVAIGGFMLAQYLGDTEANLKVKFDKLFSEGETDPRKAAANLVSVFSTFTGSAKREFEAYVQANLKGTDYRDLVTFLAKDPAKMDATAAQQWLIKLDTIASGFATYERKKVVGW